jgi:hypothetical protein
MPPLRFERFLARIGELRHSKIGLQREALPAMIVLDVSNTRLIILRNFCYVKQIIEKSRSRLEMRENSLRATVFWWCGHQNRDRERAGGDVQTGQDGK